MRYTIMLFVNNQKEPRSGTWYLDDGTICEPDHVNATVKGTDKVIFIFGVDPSDWHDSKEMLKAYNAKHSH